MPARLLAWSAVRCLLGAHRLPRPGRPALAQAQQPAATPAQRHVLQCLMRHRMEAQQARVSRRAQPAPPSRAPQPPGRQARYDMRGVRRPRRRGGLRSALRPPMPARARAATQGRRPHVPGTLARPAAPAAPEPLLFGGPRQSPLQPRRMRCRARTALRLHCQKATPAGTRPLWGACQQAIQAAAWLRRAACCPSRPPGCPSSLCWPGRCCTLSSDAAGRRQAVTRQGPAPGSGPRGWAPAARGRGMRRAAPAAGASRPRRRPRAARPGKWRPGRPRRRPRPRAAAPAARQAARARAAPAARSERLPRRRGGCFRAWRLLEPMPLQSTPAETGHWAQLFKGAQSDTAAAAFAHHQRVATPEPVCSRQPCTCLSMRLYVLGACPVWCAASDCKELRGVLSFVW